MMPRGKIQQWLIFGSFMVIAAVLAVQVFTLWLQVRPYQPLGEYREQTVHSRVSGLNVPAVQQGGTLHVTGIKCVNASEPVTVTVRAYWISRDSRMPKVVVPASNTGSIVTHSPGCVTRDYRNHLPADVTPGIWRYEATDTTLTGTKVQVRHYWSQDFTVVPAP